jgi:hypothetical protein
MNPITGTGAARHRLVLCAMLCLCCQLGCAGHVAQPSSTSGLARDSALSRAARLLLVDISSRATRHYAAPDRNALVLTVDSSRTVAGLKYVWGEYYPIGAADVVFRSVVGVRGDSVTVIRSAADWAAAIGGSTIASRMNATALCAEVIYSASPRRSPAVWPTILNGSDSTIVLPFTIPDRSVLTRLESPRVEELNNRFETSLWAVERRDIIKYRCLVGPDSVSLNPTDSLPGYGYLR